MSTYNFRGIIKELEMETDGAIKIKLSGDSSGYSVVKNNVPYNLIWNTNNEDIKTFKSESESEKGITNTNDEDIKAFKSEKEITATKTFKELLIACYAQNKPVELVVEIKEENKPITIESVKGI